MADHRDARQQPADEPRAEPYADEYEAPVSPYQEGLVGRMERRARAQRELPDTEDASRLSSERPALATGAQDAPGHDVRARADLPRFDVRLIDSLREELVEIALLTAQQRALGEHVTTRLERVERLFGGAS